MTKSLGRQVHRLSFGSPLNFCYDQKKLVVCTGKRMSDEITHIGDLVASRNQLNGSLPGKDKLNLIYIG